MAMQRIANYIDGELIPPRLSCYLENLEPATGLAYSEAPDFDASDIDRAVDAAEKAFSAWAEAPLEERARLLRRLAELIKERAEVFAHAEFGRFRKALERGATGRYSPSRRQFRVLQLRHPAFLFRVPCHGDSGAELHPSRAARGSRLHLALEPSALSFHLEGRAGPGRREHCRRQAIGTHADDGLSSFGSLPGGQASARRPEHHPWDRPKVGQSLVEHPKVQAISFTGGTQTGARIAATAAPRFKKLSLELGGKNPNIVFADCDLERAVATSVRSSFFNQGEICLSGSRIFIERPIFDKFRDEFVRRTQALRVADPLVESCDVGALISENHLHKVLSYIGLAKEEGGRILTGGRQVHLEGRCEGGISSSRQSSEAFLLTAGSIRKRFSVPWRP